MRTIIAGLLLVTLARAESSLPERETYLLLDDRVIDRVENAELRIGTVTKHPGNPLFKEDKPWEVRFDNLYANVVFDEREGLYRCWYSPFIVDPAVTETPLSQRAKVRYKPHDRQMGICFATSRDGLRWDKPVLDQIELNGSTANNLVARGPHGAGIWRDEHDGDATRRFKMFCRVSDAKHTMGVAFSPDGLKWSEIIACPEINVPGDTHNNAFWSPELGKYVGITRMKTDQRLVARTESTDFVHWTRAVEVLRGDKVNQTYAMPVFRYADVYLGLLAIFNTKTDRTHCELAWSPDTITWHRIQPGTPLISLSEKPGDYDWGCAYAAATPVVLPHEIRLYYGASNGPHTNWRDGFLALATLPRDGFAGYAPKDAADHGHVRTRLLSAKGKRLCIAADPRPEAVVRVKVKDAEGKMILEGAMRRTDEGFEIAHHKIDSSLRVELEFANMTVYSLGFLP